MYLYVCIYICSSVLHISDIFARSKFVQIHFSSSASQEVWVENKNMARVAVALSSSNSRSYATFELSKLHGCILTRYAHAKDSIDQF